VKLHALPTGQTVKRLRTQTLEATLEAEDFLGHVHAVGFAVTAQFFDARLEVEDRFLEFKRHGKPRKGR
jgi:hypothetical protein